MGVVENVVKLSDIKGYTTIRKKLENKKNILQFLPKCLEEISKTNNFTYKGKKLKTSYLIDVIHTLILKYYFKKENKFYLFSPILREKYGYLYKYYMDYLLDHDILILLKKHQKGKNSRIYSISETILNGKILRYKNKDTTLLKKYKNKVSQVEEECLIDSLIDKDIKAKLVDDLFYVNIEFDKSIFYLDAVREKDNDIYNRNRYSVECINDKHIFYHFDSFGRMHTNFTILRSFIRKNCLLIQDDETCEIDISNSQPLFLAKLIQDTKTRWVDKDEFALFREITMNGVYYQFIMDNSDIKDRGLIKEMTYRVLFGRNGLNSKADILFKKIFPTIHNFIKLYKKDNGNYKILAYELQKAESNLIFNKIIREIMTQHPYIKIVTVHDSIIVSKKYKDVVSTIFNSKLYDEFNIY